MVKPYRIPFCAVPTISASSIKGVSADCHPAVTKAGSPIGRRARAALRTEAAPAASPVGARNRPPAVPYASGRAGEKKALEAATTLSGGGFHLWAD